MKPQTELTQNEIKIRNAEPEDIKQINKIYVDGSKDELKIQFSGKQLKENLKLFNKYKYERLKGFEKNINNKKQYFIVAVNNNLVIGFGQVNLSDKKAYIEKVYIDKNYKKKEISKIIIKEMINWLKKQKADYVNIFIFSKDKFSIKLYEKLGFKPITLNMWRNLR